MAVVCDNEGFHRQMEEKLVASDVSFCQEGEESMEATVIGIPAQIASNWAKVLGSAEQR